MDPKLRTLEIFRLFASTQNVTETAKTMRISQPAVSQSLRDLETQTGLSLFKRVGSRLQLTAEASDLLPHIERLIAQMERVKAHISSLRNEQAGHLSIASIPAIANYVLPQTVRQFRARRAQVELRIGSFTAVDIVRRIKLENVDIGIAFLPINEAGVRVEPLLKTAMVCVVPRGHRLAALERVVIRDLENELVIVQGPETPPGFVLREHLKQSKVPDLRILEVNQAGVAVPMVANGVGIALAQPLSLPIPAREKIAAIPFYPKIELTLALLFPKYAITSQVAASFVKILRRELSKVARMLTAQRLPCETLHR